MTDYRILIGDPSYSSWSLRGWLAFDAFDIPVTCEVTRFYQDGFAEDLKPYAPAKTVPVVKASDGALFTDSITIIEELASRHPAAGLLPSDPVMRALARSLMAEMHSSFLTLRSDCPMNTRTAYQSTPVSEALQKDLSRLDVLWAARHKTDGPWLCGDYSAADVFYAPVAARIAGYNLPVSDDMKAYVDAHLQHPSFRRFRAMGLTYDEQDFYKRDYPVRAWPAPHPLAAKPTDNSNSINDTCPYSGKPVAYFLEIEGTSGSKIYGFCNKRCRDKTVNDPEAWPSFMAMVKAG